MTRQDPVLATPKSWWKSKTMLFNMAVAALLALEYNLPSLQGMIPQEAYVYMVGGVNIVNMVLRVVTTGPVTK